HDWTLTEAVAEIASTRISAVDYAAAMLDRAEANADLGAFITLDREATLAAARAASGPLRGAALAIKDNIDTADMPTSGGTPALRGRRTGDAAVMARLRAAGGVPLGKTNLHELAFGITSNNAAFGPARNPWNRDLIPGGSSGGTAAAVAAGMAPAGLGTDTGGSCRIPAALCGVVGFRPTLHRWSQAGVVPISSLRDTPGPLARSVADCRLLDDLCAGARAERVEPDLRGKRLGLPRAWFWADLEAGVARGMQQALNAMTSAGAEIVETDVPGVAALEEAIGFPTALFEAPRELALYLALSGDRMSVLEVAEGIAGAAEKGILGATLSPETALPAAAYQAALGEARPALRAAFARAMEGLDALVVPCTPLTARPIGQEETVALNGAQVPAFATYIRNTDPSANAGLPALTVPGGLAEGEHGALPFGVEFIGAEGSDGLLLALGEAYEAVRGPMPVPPV
ncbi:MAG: amidase family protein, partial [Pseudomonadota bacterium]